MRKSVKSPVVLLAAVALSLVLAACGGGDSSKTTADPGSAAVTDGAMQPTTDASTGDSSAGNDAANASTSDLCQLLDNGTITSITGVDFSTAVATDDGTGTCTWDLTSTGGLATVSVIATDSGGSTFEMNRGVAASMFDDVTDVSVAGADHAFTYMGGVVVAVDLGGDYVQVLFMNFGNEVADPAAPVKLAEEVAKNW